MLCELHLCHETFVAAQWDLSTVNSTGLLPVRLSVSSVKDGYPHDERYVPRVVIYTSRLDLVQSYSNLHQADQLGSGRCRVKQSEGRLDLPEETTDECNCSVGTRCRGTNV